MDRTNRLATVFGASGFLGTQLVQALARRGYRIRAAVRRPDLAGHLPPLGHVGQVVPVQANLRYPDSVRRAVQDADLVVNLVGIGFERGKQKFRAVHVGGARAVAEAARGAGAQRLVHVSVLGADPDSRSAYARSKAQGETEVLTAFPEAVIVRPSVMFGPDDTYFNRIGLLAQLLPALPLIGGEARLQPVYVGDVADALAAAGEGEAKPGRIYEFGGPEVETQHEVMSRVLQETGRNRPLLPVSPGFGKLLALPFAVLPFAPLLTGDLVEFLQVDKVVSPAAQKEKRNLAAFGIEPTAMEAILPSYLWQFRQHGQFSRNRVGVIR